MSFDPTCFEIDLAARRIISENVISRVKMTQQLSSFELYQIGSTESRLLISQPINVYEEGK